MQKAKDFGSYCEITESDYGQLGSLFKDYKKSESFFYDALAEFRAFSSAIEVPSGFFHFLTPGLLSAAVNPKIANAFLPNCGRTGQSAIRRHDNFQKTQA